jgi:hypothetical protein
MTRNKVIWCLKVYSTMSCNFSFVGTPGVALVNGKLSLWPFEGGHTSVSATLQCAA